MLAWILLWWAYPALALTAWTLAAMWWARAHPVGTPLPLAFCANPVTLGFLADDNEHFARMPDGRLIAGMLFFCLAPALNLAALGGAGVLCVFYPLRALARRLVRRQRR